MHIDQRAAGEVVVLSVVGDITMEGFGQTRVADKVRSVLQEGHTQIVLDLAQVRYVDSAGLGDLVEAAAAVQSRKGAMKLVNIGRRIKDLLVMTKLLTTFDCYENESEALASFTQLNASPSGYPAPAGRQ